MVCIPAPHVPALLEECGRIGARHIHILTSGFKESGTEEGRFLEARIAGIARENGLLIIGPNCMGPYSPGAGLTAWGAIPGARGPLGVISQSGTITQRLTEYAFSLGIGTDKAVSVGNGTVLGSLDFLEFMGQDDDIRVIAMYIEGTYAMQFGYALCILCRSDQAKGLKSSEKCGKTASEKSLERHFQPRNGPSKGRQLEALNISIKSQAASCRIQSAQICRIEVSWLQRPAPAHGARGLKYQAKTMLEKYLRMFGKLRTGKGRNRHPVGSGTALSFQVSTVCGEEEGNAAS
jgi:hypothetical protein